MISDDTMLPYLVLYIYYGCKTNNVLENHPIDYPLFR